MSSLQFRSLPKVITSNWEKVRDSDWGIKMPETGIGKTRKPDLTVASDLPNFLSTFWNPDARTKKHYVQVWKP